MSLVEILAVMGIMSVMMAGMISYMSFQQREATALKETLAKLDVEKLLIAALADGTICSAELSNSVLNPSAPYAINASNPATLAAITINLNGIHASAAAGSPFLVQSGVAPSPMTNTLLVDAITLGNLQSTGVADQYLANLSISFNGNLVRSVKPVIMKKTITTNPADPITAKRITGCLGTAPSPAPVSGLMTRSNINSLLAGKTASGTYHYGGNCTGMIYVPSSNYTGQFVFNSSGSNATKTVGGIPRSCTVNSTTHMLNCSDSQNFRIMPSGLISQGPCGNPPGIPTVIFN